MFDKVRNGEKKQTIRPYENYVHLKRGDKIHCYSTRKVEGVRRRITDELLYVGKVTVVVVALWKDIRGNYVIARRDGFKDSSEMQSWFTSKYGDIPSDRRFRLIRWS